MSLFIPLAVAGSSGETEETTITIFDQKGRDMSDPDLDPEDIVDQHMRIKIEMDRWFGLWQETVEETNGGSITADLDQGSRYHITVSWMGDEIYRESRTIEGNTTIHLNTVPSRMIRSYSRESIQTSSDLRDVSTPHYNIQFGLGDSRKDMRITTGETVHDLTPQMTLDGDDVDFVFRNSEPGEYTDWSESTWMIFEDSYHYSASSSELVGDNMLVLQWQYGYFDTSSVILDNIIKATIGGAVVGGIAGTIVPGAGTAVGAVATASMAGMGMAIVQSLEPELARVDAPGGVGAITAVITPRYVVLNSIIVDTETSGFSEASITLGDISDQEYTDKQNWYEIQTMGDPATDMALGTIRSDWEKPAVDSGPIQYDGTSDSQTTIGGIDGIKRDGVHYLPQTNSTITSYHTDSDMGNVFYHRRANSEGEGHLMEILGMDNKLGLEPGEAYNLYFSVEFYYGGEDDTIFEYQDDNPFEISMLGNTYDIPWCDEPDVTLETRPSDYMDYQGTDQVWYFRFGTPDNQMHISEFTAGVGDTLDNIRVRLPFARNPTIPGPQARMAYATRSVSIYIEEADVGDDMPTVFEDTVHSPATRLLRGHLPVYQPGVGQAVEIPHDYALIGIDVRNLPDVTLSLDWSTPEIHIHPVRYMLSSEAGNWSEMIYLLATDREEGFEGVSFVLSEPGQFRYRTDIHDYHSWTGPGEWSSVRDWSSVYYNGTHLNYPSRDDWGWDFSFWEELSWRWSSFWEEYGPLARLALIGLGILIVIIILLIVAPWVIFGAVKVLVFTGSQVSKGGKRIAQSLRGKNGGKKGGW